MRRRLPRRPPAAVVPGLLAAVLILLLAAPSVVRAASIEASEFRERSDDPISVTFSVRVAAPAGLESASLVYKVINPDGNVGGSGDASFAPGAETDVTFTLRTITFERYIPVGSTFVYHWELTDGEGATLTTEDREYIFFDGRYVWQITTEGQVTVFWYGRNEDRAMAALESTLAALGAVGNLVEAEVPYPIKVMVWGSEDEGELARRPRGATFESQVVTGGQRVAPDLIFVFEPTRDVVQHEVAHIVTHVAGDGPFTSLPSWLDEGVAVWAQGAPGIGYAGSVALAIQADRTLSLRSMQSASNLPGEVNLFYGQSYSTVEFMIQEFGQPQFAELFRVFFAGSSIDDALEQVYGFNQNGLYNAWREHNGLAVIAFAAATPTTFVPAEATRAPFAIPTPIAAQPAGTPAGAAETPSAAGATAEPPTAEVTEADSPAASGFAVALVTVLIAAVFAAGGVVAFRRSRG